LALLIAPQAGEGVGIVGKTIIRQGNAKPKRCFLSKIVRAEVEFAIGYSESQAGSNAAAMELEALRDEERSGGVVEGRAIWTTSSHFADGYWVGARTDSGSQRARAWVRGACGGPGLGGIRGPGSSWAAFGAGSWTFIYNTLRIV
jgi:alkylation response protein AidB-like acyl-CoA dehydrogenase